MSKAITRQQFEELEEKLPLRGGVLYCSQRESENAIEQLIREANRQLSAAPARRLDEDRAIHNAAIDAYLEKEQAGRASKPGGMGWQLAGLAFLVFIVFVIGFG